MRKLTVQHKRFQSWRKVDAHERSRLLWAWSALIKQHKDELARLITLEGANLSKRHREKSTMRSHM